MSTEAAENEEWLEKSRPACKNLCERMWDPGYLPSKAEIKEVFPLILDQDWTQKKDWDQEKEWFLLCRDHRNPIYEFLNTEHLEALSRYLAGRIGRLFAESDGSVRILEVGAGNGRLSHFLRQMLEEKAPGLSEIIATDSGKWEIVPKFPVEVMHHVAAVKRYKPMIVICSWMPYEVDFSEVFRSCSSVDEYILIGEQDCCGHDEKTWWREPVGIPTPKRKEGFERHDLKELSKLQVSRNDDKSKTVSFRRYKVL